MTESPDKIIDRVLYGVDVPIFSRDGRLLMLKRNVRGEEFTTGWEYVKGGLKQDESYVEAALREAVEEASDLDYTVLAQLDKDYFVDARYRNKPHYDYVNKRAVVLLARSFNAAIDATEHEDYRWMAADEAVSSVWVENGVEILQAAISIYQGHGAKRANES